MVYIWYNYSRLIAIICKFIIPAHFNKFRHDKKYWSKQQLYNIIFK